MSRSTMTWKENFPTLTSFSVLLFLQLLQLLKCLSGYMCGHNLTMKLPPEFHNYTGLNRLVNFFSEFTIAPPNKLILRSKPHWSGKTKKTTSCEMWLLGGVLQKRFPKNLWKFTVWQSLSNIGRQACNFIKERPPH